ncbi:BTAD domain-containing putative transcriptional regulator [Saccharopolyspora gloriosae]|uniref:BTAD domain-containing putative transcriptional regulator n=1 Tax=Saccharopolyspora gloriosae TaxID=455344 RepID=UPI001FB6B5DA|nr:BTAD domain-containing putative transcriptional regulator [Saccharopolyspora gloriosae]
MRRRDQLGTGTVARPMLDDALDTATRNRVCLVIAAAGWGKTTAVKDWSATGVTTTWWAPESTGDDAGRLLTALVDGARPHLPGAAPATDRGSVCDWLRDLPVDLHLVIDDLHEAGEHAVALIADLCRTAPPRLRLVLLSRHEPPFSLERLRGQGKVGEIDAGLLAFDTDEIAELLAGALGDGDVALAHQLSERTGGWPAAVCRAIESLRTVPEPRRSGMPSAARFHPYLAEEVLDREPEGARHALHRLAVLGDVTTEEPGGMFTDLARRGLLRPAGSGRWALVPPLAEFLAEPRTVTPETRTSLHRQAAEEDHLAGRYERALRHLVAARDTERCAALLTEVGGRLLDDGHVDVVLDAAAVLGESTGADIARVIGQAHRMRGRWPEAAACWRRAGAPTEPALAWRIAAAALARAEPAEALDTCAAAAVGTGDSPEESRLFATAALAHRLTGDIVRGREAAGRAVEIAANCPAGSAAPTAARIARAVLAAARGDQREARTAWSDAAENAPAAHLGRLHALRALHCTELGDPTAALAHADAALRIAEKHGDPLLRAHALTQRGTALARLGRFDEATVAVDAACDGFGRSGTGYLAWPLCVRGDVHRQRGRLERSRSAYEEALALAEPAREVLGMSAALIGLARVRAVDDRERAQVLAQRAVDLGEHLHEVRALLTRGWIAWEAGDREPAIADAALAAEQARSRGDEPGLAEALELTAVTSADQLEHGSALDEAVQIWREGGFAVEEAQALLLRHRLGPVRDGEGAVADLAERTLREHGATPDSRTAAGPLAAVARLAPPVALRALGVFRIEHAGLPVPRAAWQSRKARELLKILVAKRRPMRREELMELLWPEVDPVRAGNRLSVLLSTVRDVLSAPGPLTGSVLLTSETGTVGLDPRYVRVDVEAFLAQADRALQAHRDDLPSATALLLDAEAAYTGDFLEDDPYQAWADALADELRTTHVAVLRALTSRLRAEGDTDRVARFALRLLRDDCYDEEAHLDLVSTLLRAERFGEARRRYELYSKRMREISVAPRPFPGIPGNRRSTDTSE